MDFRHEKMDSKSTTAAKGKTWFDKIIWPS